MTLHNFVIFLLIFLTALFSNIVSADQADESKNLKLSEPSNKYASPQLYVFGGYEAGIRLSAATQFNSTTGKWDSINDMPIGKSNSCGVVVGTKIYLFGGFHEGPLKTAEVYDCESGTYTEFRALSNSDARDSCGAAVLDEFIYVAGGWNGSKIFSNVIRYNIQTSRREHVSSMLTTRVGLQLIELGGRLYAIGGSDTKTVEAYNATTDRWSEVASTQFPHSHFGATVHEGKIYVRSHAGFEVYSPDTDQWKTLTQLNDLYGSQLVSMNGRLWALGGAHSDNKGSKSMAVYNTSTNTWNNQLDMDMGRLYSAAFVVNH